MSAIQPPPDPMGRMVDWENEPVPPTDALPAFAISAAKQIYHETQCALDTAANARIELGIEIPPSLSQTLYTVLHAAENLNGCAEKALRTALHRVHLPATTLNANTARRVVGALFPAAGWRYELDGVIQLTDAEPFSCVTVNVITGHWYAHTDSGAKYVGGSLPTLVALVTGVSAGDAASAMEPSQ